MSTATSRELIEQAIEATNRRALELVEEARQRRERDRQQRQQMTEARNAGLARRHAAKLRYLATARQSPALAAVTPADIEESRPTETSVARDRAGAGHAHTRAGGDQ
ncbi:hypothetical protein ABZ341_36205 [Streptomyces sp. NPDC006173]|uniref:hypothetical protein n=1 Tax=Streptomyces sp. NPDC006173 TaxID=3155349 RepID=UPI0033FEE68D